MQLYLNDTSPFARWVLVTALEAGVEDFSLVWVDPWASPGSLTAINPFSTVPTLKPENEPAVFESLLVCQYLLGLNEKTANVEWRVASGLHRLAKGKTLMEMAFRRVVLQRFVAPPKNCELIARSEEGVSRALAELEQFFHAPPYGTTASRLSIADLCLAVALAYVRFRLPELFQTAATAKTSEILQQWEKRPSFAATSPQALKAQPESLRALKSSAAASR